jgi:hypothetical protein
MNVLILDEERMLVERQDERMTRADKAFHCAALDVRHRVTPQSYY